MTNYLVVFDETHNPLAKLGQNYNALQQDLKANNFNTFSLTKSPISRESLQDSDILVIPCPAGAKLSEEEIATIDHWVREDGGGLLLLSHAGGDEEQETNLNALAEKFGIGFENEKVIELSTDNEILELSTSAKIVNFRWHPITEGIKDFYFRLGCTLTFSPPGIAVASSGGDTKPPNEPVIVAVQYEEGRIVAAGSFEILQDQVSPNLEYSHNAPLAKNIFNWLISDKHFQRPVLSQEPVAPSVLFNQPVQAVAEVNPPGVNSGKIMASEIEYHKDRDILNELVQLRTKVLPAGVFSSKLIFVGDGNVGKTSLAFKSVGQRFIKDYIPTLGTNIFRKSLSFGKDTTLNCMIWDLGGQDIMRTLRRGFFAGAEAIFLIFDVTNPVSLQSIENRWMRELEDAKLDVHVIPTLLLANKIDLVEKAKCSRRDIQFFCQKYQLDYLGVSALTGEHVPEALEIFAYMFFNKKQSPHYAKL